MRHFSNVPSFQPEGKSPYEGEAEIWRIQVNIEAGHTIWKLRMNRRPELASIVTRDSFSTHNRRGSLMGNLYGPALTQSKANCDIILKKLRLIT